MGTVVFDISMSLDGFITARGARADEPMGDSGQVLHDWAFGGDERGADVLARGVDSAGAVICGRRTYDTSLPWWEADGPTGSARLPVFVVTHEPPGSSPAGGVYEFVTAGVGATLERAQRVAGDKVVCVMGGADVARQYLSAGLVDELQIHLVPVILGGGIRLFDGLAIDHTSLEVTEVIDTQAATHLRYRVVDST
jgi:dihydrofolate reductase